MSAPAACGSTTDEPLPKTAYGPEGMAVQHGKVLAPAPHADGSPIAGVPCRVPKKPGFHVHTHLAIYVDGKLRAVPGGIGMVGPRTKQTRTGAKFYGPRCYYDLHIHAQDGVIHVEGPARRSYTLGQFFDIWGIALSATHVGAESGTVTVFVDGRRSTLDPRTIELAQRRVIQIDLGEVVPSRPVDWSHF